VKANRAYELLASRRHVEIVEIDTGEVVLFWDTRPRETGKLARALRADLAQLDSQEFLMKWQRYQSA
jgi:hypothetical protein